jgi:WD40 repeat protein
MFSDQQEVDLGDAIAEGLAPELRVLEDTALIKHLTDLSEQLTRYLPPNQFRFRYFLIDIPEANAFGIPGGRVYVSRKLVTLAHNDDELAGVLAHELGHIVTHQTAIAITRDFRRVLGVTTVGDRADIFSKYHQLLENYRRKPGRPRRGEAEQAAADQVGLYAVARTGYSTQAFVDILDRLQDTKGKTGSWFSDLFGETPPEQRRLRETIKNMGALAPPCIARRASDAASGFEAWRTEVINYSGHRSEQLPGLLYRRHLETPLRPDISNLRFSPDGKLLLAQDDGGIHVLTRDPFAVAFYIEAPDAFHAFFSPDSTSVIVYNPALRVERWDVGTGKRTQVHEVVVHDSCLQSLLSPDGAKLACLDTKFNLSLIDVASGTQVVSKKEFFVPNVFWFLNLMLRAMMNDSERSAGLQLINMAYSPDCRYFLAGSSSSTWAFDVANRREADLPGSIRNVTRGIFAFLGSDRIVAVDPNSAGKSPVLRFPSGERITQLPLSAATHVGSPAHGDYVMLGPLKELPLGIMNLKTRELFIGFKRSAADIYDGVFVSERTNGELALNTMDQKEALAVLKLPQARLSGVRTAAVSADLNWLSLSTRSRGAVWDLSRNIRIQHTRGFRTAWFAEGNDLYADFPEKDEQPRAIVCLDQYGGAREIYKMGETEGVQYGPLLLVTTRQNQTFERKNWTLEARDYRKNSALWSHRFPREVPGFSYTSAGILLRWPASADAARDELQRYPELKDRAEKEDEFLELMDARSGEVKGSLLLKTNKGSIRVTGISASGDWVAVSTLDRRTIIYSLKDNTEQGHFFGSYPVISPASSLVALENTAMEISTYVLASSSRRANYVFPDPVLLKGFSPDGKRLLVLTSDQTVYVFDTAVAN